MSTCRVCGDHDGHLIKYSVRHYAHPQCAMNKWGAAFFERLTPWQCARQFPYLAAKRAGHGDALIARALLELEPSEA
jgi:hypothetical protein